MRALYSVLVKVLASMKSLCFANVISAIMFTLETPPPEGSSTCDKCGTNNYPFQTKCIKSSCGEENPADNKPFVKM